MDNAERRISQGQSTEHRGSGRRGVGGRQCLRLSLHFRLSALQLRVPALLVAAVEAPLGWCGAVRAPSPVPPPPPSERPRPASAKGSGRGEEEAWIGVA